MQGVEEGEIAYAPADMVVSSHYITSIKVLCGKVLKKADKPKGAWAVRFIVPAEGKQDHKVGITLTFRSLHQSTLDVKDSVAPGTERPHIPAPPVPEGTTLLRGLYREETPHYTARDVRMAKQPLSICEKCIPLHLIDRH